MAISRVTLGLSILCLLIACSNKQEPATSPANEGEVVSATAKPDGDSAANGGRCSHYSAERQVYWGDTHVHTAFSMDAYIFGTRTTPNDAYRFATGEAIDGPVGADGAVTYTMQIDRPLDFVAVTDHAENIGNVALCTRKDSAVYNTKNCVTYRGSSTSIGDFSATVKSITAGMVAISKKEVCDPDTNACNEAGRSPWNETRAAAERWNNDDGDCSFTAFSAYEYSLTPEMSKIHRNVIYRTAVTNDLPIHSTDEPEPYNLLKRLQQECIDADTGCDVLTITHNANLSNGRMYKVEYPGANTEAEQKQMAELRARIEPLMEMNQMKGSSECRSGMWNVLGDSDELCNFEKFQPLSTDCKNATGEGALLGKGCTARQDYARYAIAAGMQEQARIGSNPYKQGFIGATDTHSSNPGDVLEWNFGQDNRPFNGNMRQSPGGLMAAWAEENTRDSLFSSMRRREVYATSGSRIRLRVFGGENFGADICDSGEFAARGYNSGVPMGTDLPELAPGSAPEFVVSAVHDAGSAAHPGNLLQRVQMIKVWADEDGNYQQRVADIAGDTANGGDFDSNSCAPAKKGATQLCGIWKDPEFDAGQNAAYYARVIENPSCRWTTYLCRNRKGDDRPAQCDDPTLPKTLQERAWSSPIWYNASR